MKNLFTKIATTAATSAALCLAIAVHAPKPDAASIAVPKPTAILSILALGALSTGSALKKNLPPYS